MAVGVFVDVHGRKVFSFGWWGTREWSENGRRDAPANGDVRGRRGEVGSLRFAEFLSRIPPFSCSLEKNPLSLKTHYSSIGLLEGEKREGGEGLIW